MAADLEAPVRGEALMSMVLENSDPENTSGPHHLSGLAFLQSLTKYCVEKPEKLETLIHVTRYPLGVPVSEQ